MKTNAVRSLIIANAVFFACEFLSPGVINVFALWPLQSGEQPFHLWQIVTYAFLHEPTEITHILFNMFGLWMFGTEVERFVGARQLLLLYFASIVTAALSQLFVPALLGAEPEATIGASGGVFGVLLGYAYLFPKRKVMLLVAPIPMPAWLFATLYAGVELFLGFTGAQASVAHFAHLGGMVGGALVILRWRLRYRR